MLDILRAAASDEKVELVAWVIMPDHFHAVVAVPGERSLGRFVQLAKGRFAREYNLSSGRQGSVWQDRYHERALRSDEELFTAIEYVHLNPVKAGIVGRETEYEWSSARQVLASPSALSSG